MVQQLLEEPSAIGDMHRQQTLVAQKQLHRDARIVTFAFQGSYDIALRSHVTLTLGDTSVSLIQSVQ
jgi:hypothetical protein